MTQFRPNRFKSFKYKRKKRLSHINPDKFKDKSFKREWINSMYPTIWPERK